LTGLFFEHFPEENAQISRLRQQHARMTFGERKDLRDTVELNNKSCYCCDNRTDDKQFYEGVLFSIK
jgi:hypothetical protein